MEENPNPYAAPRATVTDVTPEQRRRPVLVWIICIFVAIGILGGVASTIALLAGRPFGGAEVAQQLSYLSPLDHVGTLILSALSAFAYIELFRLKRRALPWAAWTFGLNVVVVLANLAFRPAYRAILDGGGLISIGVSWAVTLAIVGYIWRLRVNGVLQ
jgi:hypothetical protein